MDVLRDAVVKTLREKFPEFANNIKPFVGLLSENNENQISYKAPGMMVCIVNCQEAPDNIAPWELRCNMGLVVTANAPSASDRDAQGWQLAIQAANVIYRNTWGISPQYIRPAIISTVQKNDARKPDGTPSGVSYWTVTFYNWMQFEGLLR